MAKETVNEMKRQPMGSGRKYLQKPLFAIGVHIQNIQGTQTSQWPKENNPIFKK